MGVRIGLAGQRADLAVEVASLALRAGAQLVPVGLPAGVEPGAGPPDAGGPSDRCSALIGAAQALGVDLLVVDVEAMDPVGGGPVHPVVGPHDGSPHVDGPAVGAPRGQRLAGPRSEPSSDVPTVVVCRSGEAQRARAAAELLNSPNVVELPLGAAWLSALLAPPAGPGILGVVGAVGGVGASTVAIACAVGAGPDCLLVDADPDSPGLDLALGIPEGSGVRWSQIPESADPLDAGSLRAALPQVAGVTVVTGPDRAGPGDWRRGGHMSGPTAGRVAGVLGVGRSEFARTVVDLGRGANSTSLLGPGDAAALVVPASLSGVVAGRRALERLPVEVVVVLLRPSGRLPAADVAEQLGVEAVLEVPNLRRAADLSDCGDLLSGRTRRALRNLGEQVWQWSG